MKREPEIIGAILALIVLLSLIFGYLFIENAVAMAYEKVEVWELGIEEVEGFSGCAISSTCSESLNEWFLKDNPVYYGKLERGSVEYWHSYCSLLPDKCG